MCILLVIDKFYNAETPHGTNDVPTAHSTNIRLNRKHSLIRFVHE